MVVQRSAAHRDGVNFEENIFRMQFAIQLQIAVASRKTLSMAIWRSAACGDGVGFEENIFCMEFAIHGWDCNLIPKDWSDGDIQTCSVCRWW